MPVNRLAESADDSNQRGGCHLAGSAGGRVGGLATAG
jgi:hypothetical protein